MEIRSPAHESYGGEHGMTNAKRAWAGLVAGAAGGLVGAFVMNRFSPLWSAVYKSFCEVKDSRQQSGIGNEDAEATRSAAQAISRHVFRKTLSAQELNTVTPALHYGIGTAMGALYGVAVEWFPLIGAGRGTFYGGAVWLLADEIAMPALGLLGPITKTPLSSQLGALASHMSYGFATDFVRRLVLERKDPEGSM
jgi:putative membrane protein